MAANVGLFSQNFSSLKKVIDQYKKLYNSDAKQLMSAIPEMERWRFFIDQEKQSVGRDLKNHLVAEGIPEQDFTMLTLGDFIPSYALHFRKEIKKIIALMGKYRFDTTRFANEVFSALNGWVPFESREQGYLAALMPLFAYITDSAVTPDQYLELIKIMHSQSIHEVKKLNQGKKDNDDQEFRNEDGVHCPLFPNIISEKGFLDLLNMIEHEDDDEHGFFAVGLFNLDEDGSLDEDAVEITFIIKDEKLMQCDYFSQSEIDPCFIYVHDLTEKDRLQIYHQYIHACAAMQFFLTKPGHSVRESLEARARSELDHYLRAINSDTSTPFFRLQAIIRFVKKLELAHPFNDANTRSLSMGFMNVLLGANGFPSTILADPNRTAYYTVDEMTKEVIDGMQRTLDLARHGTLRAEISTTDILNNLTDQERDYFMQCIQLGKTALEESMLPSP